MKKNTLILSILLAVHLYLLANLRFTAWPEMFSFAYLRNNGFLLYRDMIHPYPPLLTMFLSFIYSIFGYDLIVLKIVTWLMILVIDILIFFVIKHIVSSARRGLAGTKAAMFGLGFYVFFQPFLEGNQLWFDLALVTPILLGTIFLVREKTKQNIFLAGLFFGVAALTKQTAGLFLVLSILYLSFRGKNLKNLKFFLIGPFVLGTALFVRLITEGAFADFLNWTLIYPSVYWTKFPGYVQMNLTSKEFLILLLLVLPVLPALPAGRLFLLRYKSRILKDENLQLILLFLLASFIAVYPRFSFFHFQAALAFLAVLFGYLLQKIKINYLLLVAYLFFLVFIIHKPVFARDWQKEARFYGQRDIELAQIISEKVQEDEKVFFLGLHSGHYILANRLPPEPWIDTFPWYYEVPGMQERVISGFEKDPPSKIFIRIPGKGNWYELGVYLPKKLVGWIHSNYSYKGVISEGVELWGRER